jgi:predicted thioesterase
MIERVGTLDQAGSGAIAFLADPRYRAQLEHTRASAVGVRLEVTATEVFHDGRLHRFSVVARETDGGKVLGTGEVTRVVVDAERFLGRL